jgi:hypothetical protein
MTGTPLCGLVQLQSEWTGVDGRHRHEISRKDWKIGKGYRGSPTFQTAGPGADRSS